MSETKKELTFKYNQSLGRHGWLRLTPAYSVKIVQQLLSKHPEFNYVLDPFSGTGTTGLVCAEHGIRCDLLDINPYLVWFAKTKTRNYSSTSLNKFQQLVTSLAYNLRKDYHSDNLWTPPISNIERWWEANERIFLANLNQKIFDTLPEESDVRDLILVVFCRLVIELSNAAFNHQSMSFSTPNSKSTIKANIDDFIGIFNRISAAVANSAALKLTGSVQVKQADSRSVPMPESYFYDAVITSPPYPNRMSYIRELRPYMYWLRYLTDAREAGELDWLAIGGTWGIATSRVGEWRVTDREVNNPYLHDTLRGISQQSPLLARYVHKYFIDILEHFENLYPTLRGGAKLFYIVGNSKFYDTLVPVETFYAQLLEQVGFQDIKIEVIRKRNSKKELLEFCVSATKL